MLNSEELRIAASVIIPAYNASEYVGVCIDSLIHQNFEDGYEIIIVDDGSSDDTGRVCRRFEESGKVRYFYKNNGGVSSARNYGLKKARGEYILFVDSDDSVEEGYIKNLVSAARISASDLVVSGYKVLYTMDNNNVVTVLPQKVDNGLGSMEQAIAAMGTNGVLNVGVSKCYRRGLILGNNIEFNTELVTGEDLLFNLQYIDCCKSVKILYFSDYIYTKREMITAVNSYKPELYDMIAICLNALETFFLRHSFNGSREILGTYFAGYISSGFCNLYRPQCKMRGRSKIRAIGRFMDLDKNKYSYYSTESSRIGKLSKRIINMDNAILAYVVYSVLFFFRNNFTRLYNRLRLQLIIGK